MTYTLVRDNIIVGRFKKEEDRDNAMAKYGGLAGEVIKSEEYPKVANELKLQESSLVKPKKPISSQIAPEICEWCGRRTKELINNYCKDCSKIKGND